MNKAFFHQMRFGVNTSAWVFLVVYSNLSIAADALLIDGRTETALIRIASYNIMASRMGDTNIIKEAIKQIEPDIIGIQEVDNMTNRSGKNFSVDGRQPINQAEYIAQELNMHYVFCPAIDFDDGKYGHAVLSKYPIKIVKQVALPNKDDKEQRVACATEINIPNYPAPIIAISTHLDHTDTELRLKQVRSLNSNFSSWRFKYGIPILIGDLNLSTQSNEYFELQQWFRETDDQLQFTAPAWNPDRKIDYILTSSAQEWEVKSVEVPLPTSKVLDKEWYKISDHLPLIVDMKLTSK